jgi:ketosteroid isomerase-like protein
MTSNSTEEIVGSFLERLGAQDADGVADLFGEEIDWYVPGHDDIPWSGARSRREHVPEYLHTMWPAFAPGESTAEIHKVLVDGDDAVVFATFAHTFSHNGRRFETPVAIRLSIADGKIVRMHMFEDTAKVSAAYFA